MDSAISQSPSGGGDSMTSTLEFVSMNASSEHERQSNRRIVRSTAMKSFRRKQQQQQQRTRKGESVTKAQPGDAEPWSRCQQAPITYAGDTSSSANISWLMEDTDLNFSMPPITPDSTEGEIIVRPQDPRRHEDCTDLGSPVSLLGAGRVDPFRILPVDIGSRANELFDDSVRVIWPVLRPQTTLASAWLDKFHISPIVRHALLFAAAVNIDTRRGPQFQNDNPCRLYHKVQTMKLIKEDMKDIAKTSLDDLILAVLTLGSNELETTANATEIARSPFNSPLSSTQWLNVFGSIADVPVHTAVMTSLVTRRGGLENIQIDGLAEILSFGDILHATQRISKPQVPLLNRHMWLTGASPDLLVNNLGREFEDLLGLGINESAIAVLRNMVSVTNVIDDHCRGIKPIANMTPFLDRRNAVQHSLMSLARGDELEYGEISSICVYESIRHAAIIYSAAVTFPLPPTTGIFRRLSTQLQGILEASKDDPCWQLCPRALLWILVLGGIASTGTVHRNWYVKNLAAVSAALKLVEWDDVAKVLENCLWLESACDPGGRLLWMEVMNEILIPETCDEEWWAAGGISDF